jgi:integrase
MARLTASSVEKIKPASVRREIPDALLPGFYLIIQDSGAKSFAVRYRYNGRPRKFTLGSYPALSLEEARKAARAAFERVQVGDDPAHERKLERARQADGKEAFEEVARQFIQRWSKPRNRTWAETARILGLDPATLDPVKGGLVARWRDRKVGEIRRADIVLAIDDIIDRGAPIYANRTLAALRKLFAWAAERYPVEANPCSAIKAPAKEKARDRVLTDDELRRIWTAADGLGLFRPIIKLLILTGQRREEVAGMLWKEIDFKAKLWTLPRGRVKTDAGHTVPLSASALAILEAIQRIKGQELTFSATGRTPLSGFSKIKDKIDAKADVHDWRLHDIRRTVATGMAKLGIQLPVIEKVLNHTSGTFRGVLGVYQRHSFDDEKRTALNAWANHVAALVEGRPANVTPIRRAKR